MKLATDVAPETKIVAILGSDAEAPLKPVAPRLGYQRRNGTILGSDAEAPLKRLPPCGHCAGAPSILGSDAEAPLKPNAQAKLRSSPFFDPRQRCRGPVEAP